MPTHIYGSLIMFSLRSLSVQHLQCPFPMSLLGLKDNILTVTKLKGLHSFFFYFHTDSRSMFKGKGGFEPTKNRTVEISRF